MNESDYTSTAGIYTVIKVQKQVSYMGKNSIISYPDGVQTLSP